MAWDIDVRYKIHQHLANEIFSAFTTVLIHLAQNYYPIKSFQKRQGAASKLLGKLCLCY